MTADDHEHDGGHPHRHPPQPDHPEPRSYHALLGLALRELFLERGVYSLDEERRAIEALEAANPGNGGRIIARAWVDPAFKAKLLREANAAVKDLGLDPGHTELTVLENDERVHNVVVCTLCSCYPRAILGQSPAWYKSKTYRARVVREPRKVLAEFGTLLPDEVAVRVHDSTAELRYIVMPQRPAGTEAWSEEQLAALVTRDAMIGVQRDLTLPAAAE